MLPFVHPLFGRGGYTSPDADARAYTAAMTTEPTDARKELISNLIVGLKSDGVWSKLTKFSLFASHTKQAGLLDVKNPSQSLLEVGSLTFTQDRGFQASSGNYINVNNIFFTSLPGYSSQDVSYGFWHNRNVAAISFQDYPLGPDDSNNFDFMAFGCNGSSVRFESYLKGNYVYVGNVGTDGTNTFLASNPDPGSKRYRIFRNGSVIATYDASALGNSTGVVSLFRNGSNYSSGVGRYAMFFIGNGLTDAQLNAFYNRLNTYLTAIGAN